MVGRVLGHNIDVVLEQDLGAALEVSGQLLAPSVWLAGKALDNVEEERVRVRWGPPRKLSKNWQPEKYLFKEIIAEELFIEVIGGDGHEGAADGDVNEVVTDGKFYTRCSNPEKFSTK